MFKFISEHKRGVIGTTLFHLLILVFFIIYKGFSTPLPLPDAEGILVNFGTEETGFGDLEPQKTEIEPTEQEVIEPIEQTETVEELTEEKIEDITEVPDEEMITQDIEDAPEVKEAEKRKKEEEEKEKKRIEEEQKKEYERIAELKRIAEKKRKDSIVEAKRIEQQRIADQIKKDMANRFTGNQSNSQGDTQGTGNQGKTDGDPYAGNYDGSGKGEGVSWNLDGRNPQLLPKPEYIKQEQGTIVVEVKVDQSGNVVEAIAGKKGTTITDHDLHKAAEKAAYKAIFDTKPDAPPRQTGSITYFFKLE